MKWIDPDTGIEHLLRPDNQFDEEIREFGWWAGGCKHEESDVVWAKTANGRDQLRNQCRHCGYLHGSAIKHFFATAETPREDREKRRLYDENIELRRNESYRALARRNAEWWDWFDDYLKSDQWRHKRALVMKRAGYVCEGCGEHPAEEVHHLTYDHVGHELLYELRALCSGCHARAHGRDPTPDIEIDIQF